jgi:formate dehydrogenase iron-sulfur subunit
VAKAPTRDVKYVIANADEGDPGAYVDRFIMELDPHALIEGMTIAARAVGAGHGWIYLRSEYPLARLSLERALDEARRAGRLGDDILGSGFAFDIQVFTGHGSYVCGEETALIHSLEGRRPEPSVRPPFPTESGYQGRPTLVNNVETLASVPWIIRHGGAAYSALGTGTSRGTKVLSLNSLFARPGLYEVDFGTPVRRIVEQLGGGLRTGSLKGLIIGGPLAGIIPPHLLDTPLGFDELRAIGASVGHGGVIGFDHSTSIESLIHHVVEFGASESCGKCTPCALGCPELARIFAPPDSSRSTPGRDREMTLSVVSALKNASLCGHGAGVAEFVASALQHYGKELQSCWK